MDKQLKKKTWTVKRIATFGGIGLFVLFVSYQVIFADRRSKLKIEKDKITISEVKKGEFKEYIPQTGIVEPSRTVYLDAIEGGNIKRIVSESGAILKKGDVILELTNLTREISVLEQESNLTQTINRGRDTRLTINSNSLRQQESLINIDNALATLKPKYERQKQLFEKKLISKQEFEQTEADYKANVSRRIITYQAFKIDSISKVAQLADIDEMEAKLLRSLAGVGRILENLTVRTPIDGQLSTPHWDIGQGITGGQRMGQVDIIGSYKVRVPIDELYYPRISKGLHATTDYAGKTYNLVISYIYPTIQGGRFEVDMDFDGETPQGIRRGQSLRMRIELGQSSEELLLTMGGFYKDTGGNWIFILDGENRAIRRDIKLGRKMGSEYFEVLEGLKPGDKVITSSYENFGNNEVLILN